MSLVLGLVQIFYGSEIGYVFCAFWIGFAFDNPSLKNSRSATGMEG